MWSLGEYVGVLLMVSCVPYGMYLVAWLGEGRRPGDGPRDAPVWRDQSRAFLPGDFGLALFTTSGLFMHAQGDLWSWTTAWWWRWGVGAALAITVWLVGRRVLYSADDYTPEQWRSPSKRYHDFIMFGAFPFVVIGWALPGYLAHWTVLNAIVIALGLLGIASWVVCLALDAIGGKVPNARQHPSEWTPLWLRLWVRWSYRS